MNPVKEIDVLVEVLIIWRCSTQNTLLGQIKNPRCDKA